MQYYPINLNIAGKDCAVIGGVVVAERKSAGGAKATVISTELLLSWLKWRQQAG